MLYVVDAVGDVECGDGLVSEENSNNEGANSYGRRNSSSQSKCTVNRRYNKHLPHSSCSSLLFHFFLSSQIDKLKILQIRQSPHCRIIEKILLRPY